LQSTYYGWSKEFLEAGKRRLAGVPASGAALRISDPIDWCKRGLEFSVREFVSDDHDIVDIIRRSLGPSAVVRNDRLPLTLSLVSGPGEATTEDVHE
jgi:hypothetical protein